MFVCAHMYICIHVCVCCAYVCVHVYVLLCIYEFMCVYMYVVCMYVYVCARVYEGVYTMHRYIFSNLGCQFRSHPPYFWRRFLSSLELTQETSMNSSDPPASACPGLG